MVVALPAGGAVDALARVMAEHMRVTLGQPIVVENMGGAGGTLAIGRVVRSAPDGYTLGMGTLGQYVISGAVYTLPFDMLADLDAGRAAAERAVLDDRAQNPAGEQRSRSWSNGSRPTTRPRHVVGTASLARFCGMAFQKATGTNFQFVPYRGGAPALQDLVAGNVDLIVRSRGQFAGAVSQRQHQGLCGDGEDALVRRRPRCRPPTRPACLASTISTWHRSLGAEGHAGGRRRQGQRRGQRRDGRSRRA